jgi:hypothetical protein
MTRSSSKKSWQTISKEAQDYRDSTLGQLTPAAPDVSSNLPKNVLPVPNTLLDPAVISITESSTESLLAALATGKLTAVAVTQAYLQRAVVAQRLVNCLTELLATSALSRARQLDL